MSDSSDDESLSSWVMYKDRKEWQDVTPIKQDDGPNPIVAINYSEKFQDVYDYFRAIVKANEMSERALTLTADALKLNAANYTVWQFRRMILRSLNKNWKEELEYSRDIIEDNLKNYQVWHHRMLVVQHLNDPTGELEFIAEMLQLDSKNYHAWQYRQWLITTFNLFENELEYTEELLKEDVRNNSAWNQRYFIVNHTTKFSPEAINKEVDFTLEAIKLASLNESAWNYLKGILFHSDKYLLEPKVMDFCNELYKSGNRSPYLLQYLTDAVIEELETCEPERKDALLEKAVLHCKELAEGVDVIRVNYWNHISATLQSRYGKSTKT